MILSEEKLKNILVDPGFITVDEFQTAIVTAEEKHVSLLDAILDLEFVHDDEMGQLIAQNEGWKFISLRQKKIDEEILNVIPEAIAKSKGVILFEEKPDKIELAMIDPTDLETKHMVERTLSKPAEVFL